MANALQITGATVNSAADAFRVEGVTANIDLSGATVAGANGILMSANGSAAASLSATSSSLTGAIMTAAGGVSDVTLPRRHNLEHDRQFERHKPGQR